MRCGGGNRQVQALLEEGPGAGGAEPHTAGDELAHGLSSLWRRPGGGAFLTARRVQASTTQGVLWRALEHQEEANELWDAFQPVGAQ